MKKTVKVLLSLVLVCLFAFQFASVLPTAASAEHVDSKWDNIPFEVKYFVLNGEGKYEAMSDELLQKASYKFVGEDLGESQSVMGNFLNGDFVLTPPQGYYAQSVFIAAEERDGMGSHTNLLKFALADKSSGMFTIKRGALATQSGDGIDTNLLVDAQGATKYVMNVLLSSPMTAPSVSYNDGWLGGKVGSFDGSVVKEDDGSFTHTVSNTYTEYAGGEICKSMTLVYDNGSSMNVEAGDVINLCTNATITGNFVVPVKISAKNASYVYGEPVPELTLDSVQSPAGYTVTAQAVAGEFDADGNAVISVVNVAVASTDGTAIDADKLELTTSPATLSVTKRDITISAKPVSSAYTGSAVNATEYELTAGSLGSDKIESVSFTGGPVNVGTGMSTPSGAVIKNEAGEDVTKFYNISYVGAEVQVTACTAEVVIKADDASKVYDGTKLEASSASATGLVGGDKLENVVVSGEATVPGTDGVAKVTGYTIKNANGEDVTANYSNIKLVDGKLSITKREITVTTGSAKKEYDKTPLTTKPDDYKITNGSLVDGHKLSLTLNGTITDPGTAKNTVKDGSIKITDAQGRDYTAYYMVSVNPGELEITGKKVIAIKVKAASAEKVYDGQPLTAANAEVVEGKLEDGDTLVADITASITNAGSTANKINKVTIKDASGKDVTGKYTITTEDGTLTITKRALKITAKSAEKVYDGKALTANSCEVSNNIVKGHNITVTVTGSQTQIGSSKNKASNAKIVDANKNDVTGNYDITYVDGTLTVKAANAKPKTGDDANMGLWIGLMAASAVIIVAAVLYFIKRGKKNNEQQ